MVETNHVNARARFLLAILAMSIAGSAAHAHQQVAFWRSQDVRFVYRGQATIYDCEALRQKIRQVLSEIGAHIGTRVEPVGCHVTRAADVPAQMASFQIRVVSPAPASTHIEQERAKLDSRRALLGRLGVATESAHEFPADWRSVDVVRSGAVRFDGSDCELLRQLREQVLSKLAVKVLAQDRRCSMQRLRLPTLTVAVLVPSAFT